MVAEGIIGEVWTGGFLGISDGNSFWIMLEAGEVSLIFPVRLQALTINMLITSKDIMPGRFFPCIMKLMNVFVIPE
jgi:hypothetical protein